MQEKIKEAILALASRIDNRADPTQALLMAQATKELALYKAAKTWEGR